MTSDHADRKRKNVRLLQRYLLNPPAMLAVRTGLVPGYVLIESIGRRSGKRRRTVVGMRIENSTGWVVAEHGSHAGYVQNIQDEFHRPRVHQRQVAERNRGGRPG